MNDIIFIIIIIGSLILSCLGAAPEGKGMFVPLSGEAQRPTNDLLMSVPAILPVQMQEAPCQATWPDPEDSNWRER